MAGQGSSGNVLAALCNLFIPGLGQLVQGRFGTALMFFLSTSLCYLLAATVIFFFMWFVGAFIHLWSIINAAKYHPYD